jgi:hypothetical protein
MSAASVQHARSAASPRSRFNRAYPEKIGLDLIGAGYRFSEKDMRQRNSKRALRTG